VPDDVDRLRRLIHGAGRAVALTGAGISTESGIPDFRSGRGIWAEFDPLEVGHIRAFRRDPARVWRFYRLRIATVRQAQPNAGHHALAQLERDGRLARVITQNVDGLHRAAGSDAVEVHGSLDRVDCLRCGARLAIEEAERRLAADPEGVPRCHCGAPLKPGVVLFGEMLPEQAIDEAFALAASCDLLLAAGSTLEVHPIGGLPDVARRAGATVAIVNRGPTAYDDDCDLRIEGALGDVLPRIV
jgi:NAD-dependent protein deacetylase/lipoamidase